MRKLILLVLTSVAISTQVFSQITNEFFEVSSATSQGWAGGAAGSGSGVNYIFNVVLKKDTKLEFDSVWITGYDTVGISTTQQNGKGEKLKKGSSLTVNASQYFPGEVDRYNGYSFEKKVSKPPVDFKGAALLRFFVNGNIYYYAVENMQNLAPIAYP